MAEIVEKEYAEARRLFDVQCDVGGGLVPALDDQEKEE